MDMKELPGAVPAVAAEETDDLERLPAEDLHLFVAAVGHVEELLALVGRESDVERSAFRGRRVALDVSLPDEGAVRPEYLNPVVDTIAHIDQAVGRNANSVHSIELSRAGSLEQAGTWRRIVGLVAVGSPV